MTRPLPLPYRRSRSVSAAYRGQRGIVPSSHSRVIMKTLVLPKRIHSGRDIGLVSMEAAESREVLIPDLKIRQRCRKYRAIELGIFP
jgi:hypothetical protein